MTLYLIGYMYAGKTTLGRQLARRLGYKFVDTDQLFEQRYRTSISLFFEHYGEEAFRLLERKVLESTADLTDTVVSTGGGTPIHADNMTWMLVHGTVIYLQVPFDGICARMATSRKQRPLLQHMDPLARREYVHQQLAFRDPIYRQAHIIFEAFDPDIDSLLEKIN